MSRMSSSSPWPWICSPLFSSKGFVVLSFTLKSVTHSGLTFMQVCCLGPWLIYLANWSLVAPAAFVEKTVYHSSIGLHLYLKKLFGLLVGAISECHVGGKSWEIPTSWPSGNRVSCWAKLEPRRPQSPPAQWQAFSNKVTPTPKSHTS